MRKTTSFCAMGFEIKSLWAVALETLQEQEPVQSVKEEVMVVVLVMVVEVEVPEEEEVEVIRSSALVRAVATVLPWGALLWRGRAGFCRVARPQARRPSCP